MRRPTCSQSAAALAAAALVAACWDGTGGNGGHHRPMTEAERIQRGREIVAEVGHRCEGGEEAACWRLSTWLAYGTFESNFIIPPDAARALPFAERSCERGTAAGCLFVGRAYAEGRGTARDDAKAMVAFRRACDTAAGEAGCASLGRLIESGRGGRPADPAAAAALYLAACTNDESSGCAPLGSLYRRGAGVPRDYAKARQLYSKVCADFPVTAEAAAGCAGLGVIYERGLDVPQSFGKAHGYYARACDAARDRSACTGMERIRELLGY